jgi:hypothetical protein
VKLPVCTCERRDVDFGDAGSWEEVPEIALVENLTATEPAQGTTVRCLWSESAFHVLFTCVDREPWATITARDGPLWEEEVVEVFIDPVGDLESYFEFEVNPLNAVLDLVLRKNRSGYRKDFGWDCEDLRTEVVRTKTGWTAEFLIPFASMTMQAPKVGAEWRANFYRIDRPRDRNRELTAWSPTMLRTFHVPQRFGILQFG